MSGLPDTTLPTPKKPARCQWGFWQSLNLAALVLIVIGAIGYGLVDYATRQWAVTASGSNLRQIGLALGMYANANSQQLPDSWERLLLAKDVELTPDVFMTPFSPWDDSRRNWPIEARAKLISTPGASDCTYIYTGAGQSLGDLPKNTVLAIEQAEAHRGRYANILLADLSVEALRMNDAAERAAYELILLDFATGKRPQRISP